MKESIFREARVIPRSSGLRHRRLTTLTNNFRILLMEPIFVHLLPENEVRIADMHDFNFPHHLPDDYADVLIVDIHTLQPVHFLDFVYNGSSKAHSLRGSGEHREDRYCRHRAFLPPNRITFAHEQMPSHRNEMLEFLSEIESSTMMTRLPFTIPLKCTIPLT